MLQKIFPYRVTLLVCCIFLSGIKLQPLQAASRSEKGFIDPSAVNLVFWPGASLTSSNPINIGLLQDKCSTTPWVSNRFQPNEWIQLDIGNEQKEIDRVRVVVNKFPVPDFDSIRPVGIRVWVGNDPVDMEKNTLVKEIKDNKDWVLDLKFSPVAGRYVRVDFTGSNRVVNCEISGLAVYSRDFKALNPEYPISEAGSGGVKIRQISGWWRSVNSREGLNLLSEKRVGNQRHLDDQPVYITTADEDATVRIELPQACSLTRIRVGHTDKLGSYVPPSSILLSFSTDDVTYHSIGEKQLDTKKEFTDILPSKPGEWGAVRFVRLTIPKDQKNPAKNLTRVELFGSPDARGTSASILPFSDAGMREIARVNVPKGASLSAGIYDSHGKMLRTLHALEPVVPGERPLRWDGKDDFGRAVPGGRYTYRVAYSRINPVPYQGVGNSASPMSQETSASTWVSSLAVDSHGNWYQTESFDEAGKAVRMYLADGTPGWSFNHNGSFGIAVDNEFAYVLAADIGGAERGQTVFRLKLKDGLREAFPGLPSGAITVNPPAAVPKPPAGEREFTPEQLRWITGTWGIDVDQTSIWVSNYRENRVNRFDKHTGATLDGFAVNAPLGIAAAPDGSLWVANSEDRVTRFSPEGKALAEIKGLATPWGVAIGGPEQSLYVTENGTGKILNFNSATLKKNWERGRLATCGPVKDDTFRWDGNSAVAVDRLGRYLVSDQRNQRLQRFNADGTLLQSIKADFGQPGPSADPESDPCLLLSGPFQYEVDLETGRWKFTHNWGPIDGKFSRGPSFHRHLGNGRDYIYYLNISTWGPIAYLIDEDGKGARRSAMFGRHWPGPEDLLDHQWKMKSFVWSDANADGKVQESEINFTGGDVGYFANHGWIDDQGAYWFLNLDSKQIEKIPVIEFDSHQNPIYDWNRREVVVPKDQITGLFAWNLVRPTPDGREVFLSGETEESREFMKSNGLYHAGGFAIARFSGEGKHLGLFHVPMQMASFAVDDSFVYAAQNPNPQCVSVYTPEGLLIARLIPGAESGWAPGWMDTVTPLTAFRLKNTDIHHVYTEEVFYSQLLHYSFDAGPENLKQVSGEFDWPAAVR